MGIWRSGLKGWWRSVLESAAAMAKDISNLYSSASLHTKTAIDRALITLLCGLLITGVLIDIFPAFLLAFLLGIVIGAGLMAMWSRMSRRRSQVREAIAASLQLQSSEAPPLHRGYEGVEWLNRLMRKVWPHIASTTQGERPRFRDWIEPLLEQYRLAMYEVIGEDLDIQQFKKYIPIKEVITSLYLNDLLLGNIPTKIEGLKIHKLHEGKCTFHLRIGWESNSCISLGVGTDVGIVPISLENLKVSSTIHMTLHIWDSPPFLSAIVVALPKDYKPTIDYKLTIIESSTTVLPIVSDHLQRFISNTIEETMWWPHRLVVPILPQEVTDLTLKLHGQLSVTIIKGENLVNLYPYVIIYCRSKFKLRTKSIENTHDPVWNEEFTLDVEDQESQSLVLQVMNETKGADELVSMVVYPLKNLTLDKDVEVQLEVHPLESREDGNDCGQLPAYGIVSVELRYHMYTKIEQVAAMQTEESFQKALAAPYEEGSYATIMDLIHP